MDSESALINELLQQDELHDLIDNLKVGILLFDSKGKILSANRNFQEIFGYSMEELQGKSIEALFPEDVSVLRKEMGNVDQRGPSMNDCKLRGRKKDSTIVHLKLLSLRKRTDSLMLIAVLDITDQIVLLETERKLAKTNKELEDFKFALDQAATVSITDENGDIVYVNDKFCEISKYSREELLGQNHRIVKSGYHPKEVFENLWGTITQGKVWTGEVCNKAKDGSIWWGGATIVPFLDESGKPYQYIGIRSDITDKKLMEEKIRKFNEKIHLNERRYRSLVQNSYDVICILNEEGLINEISPNIYQKTVSNRRDIIGKHASDFVCLEDKNTFETCFNQVLQLKGKPLKKEFHLQVENKDWHCEVVLTNLLHDEAVKGIAVNIKDITEQKQAQKRIYEMAYYDSVTKLPNRWLLETKVKGVMDKAPVTNGKFTLMILHLRNFKMINDSLGMELGDLILKEVAQRLSNFVKEKDTVFRLADDEFVLIFSNVADSRIDHITAELLRLFEQPFNTNGYELYLTINIGKSVFPYSGEDFPSLLKNAYSALYQAKEKGANQYHIFAPNLTPSTHNMYTLKNDLLNAVKNNEFFLNFQPRIDTLSNEIVGAEALIRWQHPQWGIVSPKDFISLAEESGLIATIGENVLHQACRQNKAWQDQGIPPIIVSVNFSVIQFLQTDMIEIVEKILKKTGLDPKWLEIEVTETVVMKDEATVLEKIEKLKSMGIKIAIDDFGTGYASLSYLKKLRANTLKIDRSFIKGIPFETESSEIVSSIIQLAQKLRMKTVAEGVETMEQLGLLRDIHCDEVQGFLYSKPVIVSEFEKMLTKKSACPYRF